MVRVLLGGKHGRRAGVNCSMAFVDIAFIEGGVRKDPSKGVAFARTAYLF
jgi:hypothetical protein